VSYEEEDTCGVSPRVSRSTLQITCSRLAANGALMSAVALGLMACARTWSMFRCKGSSSLSVIRYAQVSKET